LVISILAKGIGRKRFGFVAETTSLIAAYPEERVVRLRPGAAFGYYDLGFPRKRPLSIDMLVDVDDGVDGADEGEAEKVAFADVIAALPPDLPEALPVQNTQRTVINYAAGRIDAQELPGQRDAIGSALLPRHALINYLAEVVPESYRRTVIAHAAGRIGRPRPGNRVLVPSGWSIWPEALADQKAQRKSKPGKKERCAYAHGNVQGDLQQVAGRGGEAALAATGRVAERHRQAGGRRRR
jgi:hypothetical protein